MNRSMDGWVDTPPSTATHIPHPNVSGSVAPLRHRLHPRLLRSPRAPAAQGNRPLNPPALRLRCHHHGRLQRQWRRRGQEAGLRRPAPECGGCEGGWCVRMWLAGWLATEWCWRGGKGLFCVCLFVTSLHRGGIPACSFDSALVTSPAHFHVCIPTTNIHTHTHLHISTHTHTHIHTHIFKHTHTQFAPGSVKALDVTIGSTVEEAIEVSRHGGKRKSCICLPA